MRVWEHADEICCRRAIRAVESFAIKLKSFTAKLMKLYVGKLAIAIKRNWLHGESKGRRRNL